jgi:TolB protein
LQTTLPHNTPAEATTGILFLSLLDTDHYHLFAFDPLQTRFYRVTRGNWDDIHPTISPDRKILAFSSNRNGFWDLYLLDLTNNQVTQLTNTPGYDAAPSWSPDGKWLVYESYITPNGPDSGNLEIFIHQVAPNPENNNQPLQLTDQSGADFSPVWSPAGRQIAFVSQRTGNNEIWLADLDQIENRFRNISHNPQSTNQNPQWSPDGKWILIDADHVYLFNQAKNEIYVFCNECGFPSWSER